MFRVEGDLGYKHSKVKNFNVTTQFLQRIHIPSGANSTGDTRERIRDESASWLKAHPLG